MATGTLKYFDMDKRFGLIQPDDGGADLFAHASEALVDFHLLKYGQKLSYELKTDDKGRLMAAKIELL